MKATSLRVGFAAAVALALIVSVIVPSPAAADGAALQEALDDYAAGRNEQALEKLRAYVQGNPSQAEVYGTLRDVEETLLLNAMAKGGEHERYIKYLLSKGSPPPAGDMDDDAVQAKVREAVEDADVDVRMAARVALRGAGELAVPYLVKYLSSEDASTIVNSLLALRQIHSDATLPLVEALQSDNAGTRGYVAAVLGQIGDARAGPALLAAQSDEDASVAAKATKAASDLGVAGSASEAYVALGNRYYGRDPAVAGAFKQTMNLWRWEDGEMARYEVPAYLYANQMAEEAAADALASDASNASARTLLVRALLAQMAESKARAAHGKEAPEGLSRARVVAKSMGFQAAASALAASLEASDWQVAKAACGLMVDTYGGESLDGTAIPGALDSQHRPLRYAAAIAALHMSPTGSFRNADTVASLAAQAANAGAKRQVLVIDDNDQSRSLMVAVLDEAGYVVGAERQGAIGANRAKTAPTMDVIVVRSNLGMTADTDASQSNDSALSVIDELRNDPRTKDMRILVLLDEGANNDKLKEFFSGKFGDAVAGFLTTPLVDGVIASEIKAAADAGDVGPDQAEGNAVAVQAANAFAAVDPHASFDMSFAVGPLADAVTGAPTDDIKMAAIRGLGNIKVGGGDALLAALKDGSSDEMKVAAAKALGNVLSAVDATEDQVAGLIEAASGEGDIAAAALEALGQVRNPSPEDRLKVFKAHRINVGTKGN